MLCAAQQIKPGIVRFVPRTGGRDMRFMHAYGFSSGKSSISMCFRYPSARRLNGERRGEAKEKRGGLSWRLTRLETAAALP